MKNVLITGANGFIGSNLCQYFAESGYSVYGLVRKTSDLRFLAGLKVNLVYGDLRQIESINIPEEVDIVIHSASVVSDTATVEQCREGILNATSKLVAKISQSSSLKRFVYISSAITLGYCGVNISEENPGESVMYLPYTLYKKRTEEHLLNLYKEEGFPCVIIRPADVYGPKDRTSCLLMLKAAEKGVPLIVGKGDVTFPYCYIRNLCQAIFLACTRDPAIVEGQVYTVTNSTLPTWREFFSSLQKGVNKKQKIYVPVTLAFILAGINSVIKKLHPSFNPPITYYRIKRSTSTTTYDISKTIQELGYKPEDDYVSQFDTIVEWYLSYKQNNQGEAE